MKILLEYFFHYFLQATYVRTYDGMAVNIIFLG
jgi:hypothetical protein